MKKSALVSDSSEAAFPPDRQTRLRSGQPPERTPSPPETAPSQRASPLGVVQRLHGVKGGLVPEAWRDAAPTA